MITERLGIADDAFGTFLFLTISGYLLYLVLAALDYFVLFSWFRRRFNPDYRPNWRENGHAMRLGLLSIGGNAVLTAPFHVAIATGHSKVYFDVDEHGWGWLLISVVLILLVTETLVYWAHRVLHFRPLYLSLHRHHHQYRRTTPFMAVAFHPLDSFAQALPHHMCAFLFPVHVGVYLASVAMVLVWSVSIHDRLTLFRFPWLNYAEHHAMHHWYNNYNLGQYTTCWDRICGTYRSPEADPLWPPKSWSKAAAEPATATATLPASS